MLLERYAHAGAGQHTRPPMLDVTLKPGSRTDWKIYFDKGTLCDDLRLCRNAHYALPDFLTTNP
jgi:hypothetical protein